MTEPDEVFESEFDRLARWTADAIAELRPDDPIPGACNGSGSPQSLGWLATALGVGPTTRLLDTGAGLGGPAAWLAGRTGAAAVLAEPMPEAARGAHRLFGHPGVVAWSHQLPLCDASFDVALAVAVLSTVTDKSSYLLEVRRVLRPGGRLGLLDYVATGRPLSDAPANNDFLDAAGLDELLGRCGFRVVDHSTRSSLPEPDDWGREQERVKSAVAEAHAGDPVLTEAQAQEERFGRLLSSGALALRLVHAAVEPGPESRGRPSGQA
jgi:SAM-dependent methyltransferase